MGDNTGIEWTDATWNPIRARHRKSGKVGWHCTHASEGCRHCYAEGLNHRLGTGLPFKPGHEKDVEIFLDETMLLQPLRWRRPRMIFVCSMTDLFADFVPDEWIDKVFAVMALAPQHTFQVLTKRARRMREYMTSNERTGDFEPMMRIIEAARKIRPDDLYNMTDWPLPNVWLGVSAEDQRRADERIPDLLAAPAAVRFVSAEPLLGPIDLRPWLSEDDGCEGCDDGEGLAYPRCSRIDTPRAEQCPRNRAVYATTEGPRDRDGCPEWVDHKRVALDWVIAGGESGPHARPMHPDWPRGLREQCAAAGVPFFFKQWGEWKNGSDFAADAKVVLNDGRVCEPDRASMLAADRDEPVPPCRPTMMRRVGKKAAGRLLDDREHDDMPRAAR